MTCGIYLLEFKGTEKVYVGLSKNIKRRYSEHKTAFLTGTHTEKLLNAYNLYGMPKLSIILECAEDELSDAEQEAIQIFNSINNGFNSISGGGLGISTLVGERAPSAKYSNSTIESIFFLLVDSSYTYKEIAELTKVSTGLVGNIAAGNIHLWLKDKYPEEYSILINNLGFKLVGDKNTRSKYSNELIEQVFNYLLDGVSTQKEIASYTGVSISIINNISSGSKHTWLKVKYPDRYDKLMKMKGNRYLKKEVYLTNGTIIEKITNINEFARKHNIKSSSNVSEVIRGKRKTVNGWYVYSLIK